MVSSSKQLDALLTTLAGKHQKFGRAVTNQPRLTVHRGHLFSTVAHPDSPINTTAGHATQYVPKWDILTWAHLAML